MNRAESAVTALSCDEHSSHEALPALTDGLYKEALQASSNTTIINKVAS